MKKPTLKDVAEYAGVSTATVSYVLNGKKEYISPETKETVLNAVKELGYFTNMNAKSLVVKDSKLIGVVIPQTEGQASQLFTNNFYSEILSSVEYKAREKGYQIIISGVDVDENYLRIAHERNLDGIIAIGVSQNEIFEQLEKVDIPIVLIDSYDKGKSYSSVRIDDEYGSYIATKHVIQKGHKKIGFLCGVLHENEVMQKRFQGYKKALEEASIPFNEEYVFEGKVGYDSGLDYADFIADKRLDITAIVTTADILAIGAMKGLHKNGIKIPEDMSIIGFDDLEVCHYLTPGLTTVKQKIGEKGEVAMELLFEEMDGAAERKEIVLPVEITERESVKALEV